MAWPRAAQRVLLAGAAALLAVAAVSFLRGPRPAAVAVADEPALDLRLDLNRASAAELEALPGIGPALASRILAWRAEHGPFRSLEELAAVPGLGARRAEALRPYLAVSASP